MKIWSKEMTDKETADVAYWERNALALHFADGWYYDDRPSFGNEPPGFYPRYSGWRRILTLEDGAITFHIPDDFDVGTLQQVRRNWDGHTTAQKWERILKARGVEP